VAVQPGAVGREVDVDAATARLVDLIGSTDRAGELPVRETAPALSTEQAQAAGVTGAIGTFTTSFAAGQPRATNIRRIAEIVNGSYVAPGETFSLNAAAGRRTRARGFVADGAIVDGVLTDEVGGGVSQFATTLFNAAFFAGLPIPEHKPHSFYISRYPAGRESTVYFGAIDVTFRNDTDHGIVVGTSSTASSVTVTLYGDTAGASSARRPARGGAPATAGSASPSPARSPAGTAAASGAPSRRGTTPSRTSEPAPGGLPPGLPPPARLASWPPSRAGTRGGGVQDAAARRRIAALGPLAVLALFSAFDLLAGRDVVVIGLLVIAPLLAATSRPVRETAAYAVAALGLAVLLGVVDGRYTGAELDAQLVRMLGVTFGGVVAVLACRARVRAQARLAHVELVAASVQQALLTQVPSRVGQVEVATSYRSADEDALVGGDLYEVVATPWGVRVLVGDVRGKGLEAVSMAARVLGTYRALGSARRLGDDVMSDLDATVERLAAPEDFVTAVLLQIDGDELTVWNAGHPAPLLLRDGQVHRLAPDLPSPPLGLGARPTPHTHRLGADDLVLVHTDGLLEARDPGTRAFFPVDEVALRVLRPGDLPGGLRALGDEVREWAGGLSDDIAMVLVRHSPPGEDRWLRRPVR
jgi:hypothetical protein